MDKVFNWNKSSIYFEEFGSGDKLLIALHGYGQDGSVFRVFEPSLGEHYRVVSVDLPHQGKTIWKEDYDLTPTQLESLIHDFLLFLGHKGKVSLLAFSLGGNYALGLTFSRPEMVDRLCLVAADGLKNKPGFNFITKTRIGRAIFRGFVYVPEPAFVLLKISRFLGIYDEKVYQFFYSSIATRSDRFMIYRRWISSSRMQVNLNQLKKKINVHQIKVGLLFGKKDKVIPYKNAIAFAKGIDDVKSHIINQGHQLLKKVNNKILSDLLIDKED